MQFHKHFHVRNVKKLYFSVCISPAVSGTVRAVVSENSDDSNHAFGMSLMSTAITSGFIFGPAVAGTTSDPIRQYNLTINSEFTSTRECYINDIVCTYVL